jgi:DNA-directed RNA polymerase specialized sigma24 family protein
VTGDLHEAEEVVQEAFARAFIHCRGCATTRSPRPGYGAWP